MPFASGRTSRHPSGWSCAVLLCLSGCPSEDTSAATPTPSSRGAFTERAHREAFERGRTLAETALAQADPFAAWSSRRGPLAAPRLSATTLIRPREAARTARREIRDIDPTHLEPEQVVVLRVLDFALRRLERRAHGRPPSRTDPGHVVEGLRFFIAAIEAAAATGAPDLATALASIPSEARAAGHDLGAASVPALEAAIDDLEALATRLDRLGETAPEQRDAAHAAASSLRALARRWSEAMGALPAARQVAWNARIAPGGDATGLARLPERLGREALVERLRDEEASAEPIGRALEQLGRVIMRLRMMESKVEASPADAPEAPSIERCEAAWSRVRQWAEKADLAPPDPPSCTFIVRELDDRMLTSAELLLTVARRAWIDPWSAKHRLDTGTAVALVEGRIAPVSHRLAASIAAGSGIGDPSALRLALVEARHAACLAATALWIHGELDDEQALRARLEEGCPERPADAWIAETLARPHRSLQGLGLALIEPGPAAVAALERYAWAPLGLVPVLADPELATPPPTPVRIEVEELVP
jgi:hypothetical protein